MGPADVFCLTDWRQTQDSQQEEKKSQVLFTLLWDYQNITYEYDAIT